MTDNNTTSTDPTPKGKDVQPQVKEPLESRVDARYKIYNLIATTLIALATLIFAAYLFKVGQVGIGGTIAGMVIAHYFSNAGTAQAVGAMRTIIQTDKNGTSTRFESGKDGTT
jgi:hypothetical protein